jgi:hypothetical protein
MAFYGGPQILNRFNVKISSESFKKIILNWKNNVWSDFLCTRRACENQPEAEGLLMPLSSVPVS